MHDCYLERIKHGIMVFILTVHVTLQLIHVRPLIVMWVSSRLSSVHQVRKTSILTKDKISSCVHLAVTHVSVKSRVIIQNSIIVGSITPDDCHDRIDSNSNNIQYSDKAIPTVSWNSSTRQSDGRVGIVFLTTSRFNNIPIRPWTGILNYPCREYIRIKKRLSLRRLFFILRSQWRDYTKQQYIGLFQ